MTRTLKNLALAGALAASACADPAAGITADDAQANQDGGMIGSGTVVDECRGGYLGSGNVVDCPKDGTP
jgi:hypothetical protein